MIERLAYSVVWYDLYQEGNTTQMTMVNTYGPFASAQDAKEFCSRMVAKFEGEGADGQHVEYVPMTIVPSCFV
jgi:hypothetical protein